MTRAHVALGSNLGDRMATLDAAVRALDADHMTHVMAVSRVYETGPVGGPEQGPYLNAVAVLETDRDPYELLDLLMTTEERLGRVRGEHWGPRTADLDLILYDGPPLSSPELTVPRPRARAARRRGPVRELPRRRDRGRGAGQARFHLWCRPRRRAGGVVT